MARPQKCRCICSIPRVREFCPDNQDDNEAVQLKYDEYEALRLLDFEQKTQKECALKMGVSRPTVTRIYNDARYKLVDAIVNGKKLCIGGGDVIVCPGIKPECVNEPHCCHKN